MLEYRIKPSISVVRVSTRCWCSTGSDQITSTSIAAQPASKAERIIMAAATGNARIQTRDGPRDLRAVAVRFSGDRIYRFLILTPPEITAQMSEGLRRMTYSFRPLSAGEIRNARPRRIRIHRVEPGESVDSLAAAMLFETFKSERLRVLNGLAPDEVPQPGRLIKLIGY